MLRVLIGGRDRLDRRPTRRGGRCRARPRARRRGRPQRRRRVRVLGGGTRQRAARGRLRRLHERRGRARQRGRGLVGGPASGGRLLRPVRGRLRGDRHRRPRRRPRRDRTAGNFSVLAATLLHAATLAARHISHWEVLDYGYVGKPDVPSGTSRELAERLAESTHPSRRCTTPTSSAHPRRAAPRSPAPACTRSACPATRSPPRSCWRRRTSDCTCATRLGARPRRISQARCWRSAACPRSRAFCAGARPAALRRGGVAPRLRGCQRARFARSSPGPDGLAVDNRGPLR